MKTCARLWYISEFFLECEMFQTKVVEKIETHIMCSGFFFKSCRLWDKVKKYGRSIQATDDSIIWHLHFACWVTKATDTHTHNMEHFLLFFSNNSCT